MDKGAHDGQAEHHTVLIDRIMEALLALPPARRAEVCDALRYNDVFCVYCGRGSRERPNRRCQCMNDE